jgi:hypothetical protein
MAAMSRREAERVRQLDRERALYRYSSALERGDFEMVSNILDQARQDPELEHMILEVNAVYGAEMEAQQEPAGQAGRTTPEGDGGGLFARLLKWTRRNRRATSVPGARPPARRRIGPKLRNGLAIGGVVLGIALVLVIGWAAYARPTYVAQHQTGLVASEQYYGLRTPLWQRLWRTNRGGREQAPRPTVAPALSPISQPAQPAGPSKPQEQAPQRLLVRQGNISLVVQDTRAASSAIRDMVARMAGEGAYVISSQERSAQGDSPYITISVRVPVARFDEAMDYLESLAVRVLTRDETGQDVTEEYVDLEARRESLEVSRQRLIEIVQDAPTTEAVLQAEQELTRREADIESTIGRMQYLAQSAQLSSIHVDLQPHVLSQPVDVHWRPAETAREALETLIDNARNLSDFLIFFSIAILPWLALIGLVVYGIVRLIQWQARRGRAKGTQ